MGQKELISWLQLNKVTGVGPKIFQKLLTLFDSPQQIFSASVRELKAQKLSSRLIQNISKTSPEQVQDDITWLEASPSHHIITLGDENYPALLREIADPPPILYISGNQTILNDPQIAIVGSRNLTPYGKDAAYRFAKHLSKAGFCITSGLAIGVDGYSHRGAIDATGITIAVMATGLDRVYPARHHQLAHQVIKKGALISEFPIGTKVRPEYFPKRNRLISGLSIGTLIIEAGKKSGSLITARYANEQGREVFAIPGSIHNPVARGCHQLIRQGATLVEKADHILQELSPLLDFNLNLTKTTTERKTITLETPKQQQVFDSINDNPIPIDQLVLKTGLTVEEISSILLLLELQGLVKPCGGGCYIQKT